MFSNVRLILAGVALAALIGAALYVYNAGREHERDAIDDQNVEAAGVANEAAMSWRDCRDRDGVYVFETGKCRWTSADNR